MRSIAEAQVIPPQENYEQSSTRLGRKRLERLGKLHNTADPGFMVCACLCFGFCLCPLCMPSASLQMLVSSGLRSFTAVQLALIWLLAAQSPQTSCALCCVTSVCKKSYKVLTHLLNENRYQ